MVIFPRYVEAVPLTFVSDAYERWLVPGSLAEAKTWAMPDWLSVAFAVIVTVRVAVRVSTERGDSVKAVSLGAVSSGVAVTGSVDGKPSPARSVFDQ
jgi:hypothetical protein